MSKSLGRVKLIQMKDRCSPEICSNTKHTHELKDEWNGFEWIASKLHFMTFLDTAKASLPTQI